MLRLFQTGHLQETRIVQDLKDAGLEVWDVDSDTGKQWVYTAASGHFVCKPDGVVRGVPGAEKTPHLLEIKTSNAKGFKELESRGVKEAKPQHYYQMHAGMWLAGLDRALYVALRKDDEQYYIERVTRDEACIQDIERKLEQLTMSMSPPPRIAEKEGDWRCKFCDGQEVCWGKAQPLVNCRTCQYAAIKDEGGWYCEQQSVVLTQAAQLKGCDLWTTF
jgi:ribosomal protein S27E